MRTIRDEFIAAIKEVIADFKKVYPYKYPISTVEDRLIETIEASFIAENPLLEIATLTRSSIKELPIDWIGAIFGTTSEAYLKRCLLSVLDSKKFEKFNLLQFDHSTAMAKIADLQKENDSLESRNRSLKTAVESSPVETIAVAASSTAKSLLHETTEIEGELNELTIIIDDLNKNVFSLKAERNDLRGELEDLKSSIRAVPGLAGHVRKHEMRPAQRDKILSVCESTPAPTDRGAGIFIPTPAVKGGAGASSVDGDGDASTLDAASAASLPSGDSSSSSLSLFGRWRMS